MGEFARLVFGLLAGGAGYLIVQFWMTPVLHYLRTRCEIVSDLVFFANTMDGPLGEELQQRAKDRRISNRRHASELAVCHYSLPWWYKQCFLKRRNEDLMRAAGSLIGLSNSSADTSDKHVAILKQALNLTELDV